MLGPLLSTRPEDAAGPGTVEEALVIPCAGDAKRRGKALPSLLRSVARVQVSRLAGRLMAPEGKHPVRATASEMKVTTEPIESPVDV